MNYTVSSIAPSIDWLTVTSTQPQKRATFKALGEYLCGLAAGGGYDRRPWRWRGYTGEHSGPVTYGGRPDSDIIQLSGAFADEWFDNAYRCSDNATRIDLAVTVWGENEKRNLAVWTHRQVEQWKRETGRILGTKLIVDEGAANCLYLGSRESDLFARLYDKYRESGDPAYTGAWRYELEVKGPTAQRTAAWLHSVGDRPDRVRSAVHKHFVRRGVGPVFSSMGGEVPIRTVRAPSDDDTRIAWLSRTVKATVQGLIARGRAEDVWDALGLPRSVTERFRYIQLMKEDHHRNELEWCDESAN